MFAFKLALVMGRVDVDKMLAEELTGPLLTEWQAFYSIEPFGEWRDDYRSAQICAMIANTTRDPEKRPDPYVPNDFMLKMVETPKVRKVKLSPDELKSKILKAFGVGK